MGTRAIWLLAILWTGCITPEKGSPSLSIDEIAKRIPSHVSDREGWARDVSAAIVATELEPTAERVCAVLAVIAQESNYQSDPVVANLPEIVREGLRSKLHRLGPLAGPAVKALLSGKAPGSEETFERRISRLRTERDLDRFFREMTAAYRERLPGTFIVTAALSKLLGGRSLAQLNPVTTAGSMQVKVEFAKSLDEFEDLDDSEARDLLYARAGGVRAGTARLLGYEASYSDIYFRFADYNAGVYASRNAAFQALLADLTGQALTLDGDLLAYESDGDPTGLDSKSLKAMLAFGRAHDMWEFFVRRSALKEKELDFEDTDIWEEVRAAWAKARGKDPVYARIPDLTLSSPKLSGKRSTAWFAKSVAKRYQACR